MNRVDKLVAELLQMNGEALIASSHRPVHALVSGSLWRTSDTAASTEEILRLLVEIAPPDVLMRLENDCELIFRYSSPGQAELDCIVERKGDFIFARLQIVKTGPEEPAPKAKADPAPRPAPAPALSAPAPRPPAKAAPAPAPSLAPAAAAPRPEPRPAPKPSPAPSRPAMPESLASYGETARDLDFEAGGGESLELDEDVLNAVRNEARGGSTTEAFFGGNDLELAAPRESVSSLFLDLSDGGSPPPPPAPARGQAQPSGDSAAQAQTALQVSQAAWKASQAALQASQAAAANLPEQSAGLQAARSLQLDLSGPRTLGGLLALLIKTGASDLHLPPGSPPRLRLHGELRPLDQAPLTADETRAMFETALSPDQMRRFEAERSLDFSLDVTGLGRFRANAYLQRNGHDLVFRAIPPKIPTLADLGLPESVARLTQFPNGLILVTGPAGSGKSTTQAAIIDRINETWSDHVITVEDPIEYVHPVKNCLVNQREVGTHVLGFSEALRSALREDPDVILVGELRDLETIHLAITAAETGHLVIATLHTVSAARTIDRLIDVFPGSQKLQVRSMVSESLRGVISQKLVPNAEGDGRVAAYEILIADRSIANLVREGKTFQIPNALRVGKAKGMCLMDDALIDLVRQKRITPQVALENMERPEELQKLLSNPRQQAGRGPRG